MSAGNVSILADRRRCRTRLGRSRGTRPRKVYAANISGLLHLGQAECLGSPGKTALDVAGRAGGTRFGEIAGPRDTSARPHLRALLVENASAFEDARWTDPSQVPAETQATEINAVIREINHAAAFATAEPPCRGSVPLALQPRGVAIPGRVRSSVESSTNAN